MTESTYVLGESEAEHRRLMMQGRIARRWSDRFFQTAGLAPGMSVLDLGCGVGDVSLLVADIVGPSGRVLGIDRDPVAVERARARASAQGVREQAAFRVCTLEAFEAEGPFDAVIGRYILSYQPDPAATLQKYAQLLHPGGVMAFHEIDLMIGEPSWPQCQIWDDAYGLLVQAFEDGQIPLNFGRRLGSVFAEAGLGWPALDVIGTSGAGPGSYLYTWLGSSLLGLAPMLRSAGRPVPAGIRLDETLPVQLEEAVVASGSQIVGPAQFGAWIRKSS